MTDCFLSLYCVVSRVDNVLPRLSNLRNDLSSFPIIFVLEILRRALDLAADGCDELLPYKKRRQKQLLYRA